MLFSGQPVHSRPRLAPVSVSIAFHALLLGLLIVRAHMPTKQKSAYQQLFAGKETKLLWYRFKDKLPAVRPVVRSADKRPPKADVKLARQNLISAPKDAPKARQMVWQPVPDLKFTPDVKSANVLAAALPDAPRPLRRLFRPPVLSRPQSAALPDLAPAPELRASVKMPEDFRFSKAYKPFVAPTVVRSVPKTLEQPLPQAPDLAPAAPQTVAGLPSKFSGARRPFAAPPASSGTGHGRAPQAPPAAPMLAEMHNTWTGAIVGLDPAEKVAIPNASRPAQFSGGPVLRPDGGVPGSNTGAAVTVPDLYVSGSKDRQPTIVARTTLPRFPASVTSDEALHGAGRYLTVKDIGHASGTRVANAPDPRFEGRHVYTMAVQMPNITSYVGSWLMWYSEREFSRYQEDPVSAPMPVHKVDPKYIATAAEERVEGTVRVLCVVDAGGHVTHVELLRGIDERLDRSAVDAFAKWEFTPATRKGTPVAVDLLVEIPFRLAPRARK
ncbi:MAG TPA: hypothetical protein DEQ47_00755 [Solibacterales bacterium]|nr:hypothetical protein [Bryobacterales bacterium]